MKKILITATTAYMIKSFEIPNIQLLQDMGYDVEVAVNFDKSRNPMDEQSIENFKKSLSDIGVRFYEVPFTNSISSVGKHVTAYRKIKELVKSNQYVAVHTHTPFASVITRLALRHFKDIKKIYTAHGFQFTKGSSKLDWLIFYPIEKYMSKYTDVLITINHEDYTLLTDKKFSMKKSYLINGVGVSDQIFYRLSKEKINEIKNELGITPHRKVLLYVASFTSRKNHAFLLKVLDKMKAQNPNILLLLAGSGNEENKIRALVSEKGLEDHIKFVGDTSSINELMNSSDVLVSTSKREGLPVNIIEGMLVGLPCVVSNVRGNRDLVVNEKNGYVLPFEAEVFADKILGILSDETEYKKMSDASLELSKRYTLEIIREEMTSIYLSILGDESSKI
ncbi:glycosyltransferase family 4 protein [Streptococcus respiraculi]|uniref:glycosyltransferase family 4 protein n=1 Tax=Streptococcus respiraculi TaxID=2021971 RepID=UPI000E758C4A|nr:glycosyltransferase family 4 protein [Streptococcus respiraculi]